MARKIINTGSGPNTQTGDGARTAFGKINDNFDELYSYMDVLLSIDIIKEQTGLSLSGQILTINANWKWLIDNLSYTNPSAVVMSEIPYCATGKSRLDFIIPNDENGFTRIPGVETTGTPFAPFIPNNGIYVTFLLVTDGAVGTPEDPYLGEAIADKLDKGGYDGTAQDLKDDIDAISGGGYNYFKGVFLTEASLKSTITTGIAGDRAQVNEVGATEVVNYSWDVELDDWVATGTSSGGPANTDELPEGSTNLYFTTARVLATLLTGVSFATGGAIVSTDSVLVAFGKIQKQITDILTLLKNQNYINNTASGSLDLDWSKKVQRFTLTGAVVFTNTNLPTGTDTAVLEVYITGNFTIDLTAVGTKDTGSDSYDGTKWNRFIFSCTNLGSPLNVRYTIQKIN